jgi:threonylcarbamoyladenosine tRNA methylthiotransferase MtaB
MEKFRARGYKTSEFGEKCDIFVLNTCTVTENADRECRQIIRSVLGSNPDTYIVVTGCYAQLQPDEIVSIKGVDLVLGTGEKFKLFDYVDGFEKKSYSCVFTSPVSEHTDFEYAYSSDADSRTRAFLKIQDGCDYNCSFCTIPLARGRSRSLAPDKVIENAKKLIDSGYKEIVLTGVNTGDYLYPAPNTSFKSDFHLIDVLKELDKLSIPRVRISSIESNLLNDDIIQLVKSSSRICKHFHIPLQSGDATVLKRMRRRYTVEQYRALIEKINKEIPHAGIGVDVIVGFPGETESSFENTAEFINSLNVSYLHVFTYSERRDTHAVSLPGRVDMKERKRRSRILREISVKKKLNFYTRNRGIQHNVLFETLQEDGSINGFTGNYIKVKAKGSKQTENSIKKVMITSIGDINFAEGEILGD